MFSDSITYVAISITEISIFESENFFLDYTINVKLMSIISDVVNIVTRLVCLTINDLG